MYFLDSTFYLADGCFLKIVDLERLDYTNLGEPFRALARLSFVEDATWYKDSIDISQTNAARLVLFHRKAKIALFISSCLVASQGWQDSLEEAEADYI